MAELDDLMSSFPFKCRKCDAELTSDLLLAAVVTYGVVLIVGEKDGFIGWSCPGCSGLATNFTRLEIESFNQVVHAFRNILINRKIGKLCYHSFPYRFDLKDTDFSGQAAGTLLLILKLYMQTASHLRTRTRSRTEVRTAGNVLQLSVWQ